MRLSLVWEPVRLLLIFGFFGVCLPVLVIMYGRGAAKMLEEAARGNLKR